jgi:hypothetical protein
VRVGFDTYLSKVTGCPTNCNGYSINIPDHCYAATYALLMLDQLRKLALYFLLYFFGCFLCKERKKYIYHIQILHLLIIVPGLQP